MKIELHWLKRFFESETPSPVVEEPSDREKRKCARSFLETPVMYELEGETVNARTFDISAGGLFIRTTQLPMEESYLGARLVLPTGRRISCILRVAWINDYNASALVINRPPGFGASFLEIGLDDRRAIAEALRRKPF